MICGHCNNPVGFNWKIAKVIDSHTGGLLGSQLSYAKCPSCLQLLVSLENGFINNGKLNVNRRTLLYPATNSMASLKHIPIEYRDLYLEILKTKIQPENAVINCRKLLEKLLIEEFGITSGNLNTMIKKFQEITDLPEYLSNTLDYIRIVGNHSAHRKIGTNGNVIAITTADAEYLN